HVASPVEARPRSRDSRPLPNLGSTGYLVRRWSGHSSAGMTPAFVPVPHKQAENEEDNKEERSAEVEEDVEGAPPAFGSRLRLTHQPEPVDDIGCQNEPTDAEPRAQGHEAIFALRGRAARLGQCSGMTPGCSRPGR